MSLSFDPKNVQWVLWKWNTPLHFTWEEYLALPHLSLYQYIPKNQLEINTRFQFVRTHLRTLDNQVSRLTGKEVFLDGVPFESFFATYFFRRNVRFVSTEEQRIPPFPFQLKSLQFVVARPLTLPSRSQDSQEDEDNPNSIQDDSDIRGGGTMSSVSQEEQDDFWKKLILKTRKSSQELILMPCQTKAPLTPVSLSPSTPASTSLKSKKHDICEVLVETFNEEEQKRELQVVQVVRHKWSTASCFKKQSEEMYKPVIPGYALQDIKLNNFIIQYARGSIHFDTLLPNGTTVGTYLTQYMTNTLRLNHKNRQFIYQHIKKRTKIVHF